MRAVVLLAVAACGAEYEPATATWFADVGPMVRTHCASCHQPGGIAPFSLLAPSDLAAHQDEILTAVMTDVMPPFAIDNANDCIPRHGFKDDGRITMLDKSALQHWFADGMPAGETRDLPSPPSTALDADLSVQPIAPYHTAGDRDLFVCFVFDPKLTSDVWMTGLQVRPGDATLVHHATVTVIQPAAVADALAKVGGVGVAHPLCDGGAPGDQVHTWFPGNAPIAMPDGVGVPMPVGSMIGLQIHYHPNSIGGDDATAIDLRTTDQRPSWEYVFTADGNYPSAPLLLPGADDPASGPEFRIPAGEKSHTEYMVTPMANPDGELRVLSFTPHMHLLGTHLRSTIQHADGSTECLGDSGWNFDWQRTYAYDAPLDELPLLEPNNTVTTTCTYNNSLTNPFMTRMMHDAGLVAPIDVGLGENTVNEMCLANLGLVRHVK